MKKKEVVDFISNLSLLILSSIILLFPSFKITDLKLVLTILFGFYTIIKFTNYLLVYKENDLESLFTSIVSLGGLISIYSFKLSTKNLVLILLLWVGLLSLIKLKKADFYHDRENKMWILRIFTLLIFLSISLLLSLNLMYSSDIQILIISFYFIANSLLDTVDPLVSYLIRSNHEISN